MLFHLKLFRSMTQKMLQPVCIRFDMNGQDKVSLKYHERFGNSDIQNRLFILNKQSNYA